RDFVSWYGGGVTVPIYETSSVDQSAWILQDSGATRVIAETQEHAETLSTAEEQLGIDLTVSVLQDGGLDTIAAAGGGVGAEQVRQRYDALRLGDLATILYTSGTTCKPKGLEQSHANFVELCRNAQGALGAQILHDGARTLLFMPLAHVFARFVSVLTICAGVPIGHVPDTATLLDDIAT